ncbi:RAMP superfamily CRISPR-associated protein [Micropruina sp.]|uniref:RAMP superfamily CRISPR-associated protein n=1 Tax=Micropruina sp. TaxID=2737536 RepID=UPI0039E31D94
MGGVSGVLRISFASDWHCGIGQGRHGGIDRLVARDADGLPFVPAKTLLGLWRDACEKAARGLDAGADTPQWAGLVARLFGAAPGHGAVPEEARGQLTVRPARLPQAWRDQLTPSDPEAVLLRRYLTTTRFGVKIDDQTGVADDDTLRLIERARAGLTVQTGFSVPVTETAWAVEFLLHAGARLWHHTGGSRRRGAGRCTVTLDKVTPLADLLAAHADDVASFDLGTVRFAMPHRRQPAAAPVRAATDRPRVAVLTIETVLPVICTRAVRGNVATGYDYIPGSVVLPVIAEAVGARSAGLIRQGHLVVSDATPVVADERAVAMPMSLMSAGKGTEWETSGRLLDSLTGGAAAMKDAKSVRGWGALGSAGWSIAQLSLQETAHANVNDDSQRPDEDGLYTFEAIPPRTRLRCVVRASSEVNDEEWERVLSLAEDQAFGRYRRSDFGAARVTVAQGAVEPDATGTLTEATVWLTSDTCLHDELGLPEPTAAAVARELAANLGIGAEALGGSLVRVVRRESWTMTQTLPRDSRVCLAAGSVIRIRFASAVPAAELHRVLDRGLGVLRGEGFGQARTLASDVELGAVRAEVDTASATTTAESAPTEGAWQSFSRSAWQDAILQACLAASADDDLRRALVGQATSNAARGTLREAARQLTENSESIDRWLDSLGSGDGHRRTEWAAEALDLIADIGSAKRRPSGTETKGRPTRLAALLNRHGGAPVTIPNNLAGASDQLVAQALIEACLSQVARVDRRESGESEGAA